MEKQFNRIKILAIAVSHSVHDIYTAFFAPLLPLIVVKLNIPLSAVAVLHVVRNIPSLFNPLLALIAERRGVKYFVILTPAVTAIAMSLIGWAPSFWVLFTLLLITGVSNAFYHVPSPVMVKDVSGDRVGTGMSYFMVGGESARTLGPIIVTAAVSWWTLEGVYRLMPLGIITSILLWIGLRDYSHNPSGRAPKPTGHSLEILKKYWIFFVALASFILFNSAMKTVLTLYLPIYLTEQGASLWFAGISLSLLQGFGVAGTFLSGHFSDRFGRQRTLIYSAIGTVTFMIIFSLTSNIIFLCFLGFFLFSSGPVLLAIVQDTKTEMPTFMNGMYMSINFGVGSIIALAIGFLGDSIGLNQTYVIASLFGLGLIPAAVILPLSIKGWKKTGA